MPRATTLAPGKGAFSVHYQTLSREEGGSNVEHGAFTGAIGITNRFEMFGSFELRDGIRRDYFLENALGIPHFFGERLNDHPYAVDRFSEGLGDLRIGAKFRLAGAPRSYSGLSADVILKIPTSDDEEGIGTGKMDLGGNLIASYEAAQSLGLNAFAGLHHKGDPDDIEVGDEIHWGFGLQAPTRFWLQVIGEAYGVNYMSEPNDSLVGFRDYWILQGGLRASFANGFAVTYGVNKNMSIEDHHSGVEELEKLGSFLQISYTMRPHEVVVVPPPPPPAALRLSCRAESTTVRRGESVRISAEGSEPVSISWTATAGTVTPTTGSSVTWSSAGLQPGSVTVTATASGRAGATASCDVRVRVEEPPPPPPAAPTVRSYRCTEIAKLSSRIDNRCKAVLDDVAVQLRSNPSATVRITGYGDDASGDAARATLAGSRAKNAAAYLSRTHGIDASRIMAGGGTGQARTIELETSVP